MSEEAALSLAPALAPQLAVPRAAVPRADWQVESREVPADLAALADVRVAVREVLDGWQAHEVADDVVLVASELVANAVQHGCRPGEVVEPPTVHVGVCRGRARILLFVTDPSPSAPLRGRRDPMGVAGRGLDIVTALSTACGWTPGRRDGRGKTVWATFRFRPLRATPST
ncbi:ATP-binding protein [Spongisporangium articulatum]|uniref:ATP-binding protein n=1 Tax=Spongisporangium articulatum TaxID=3362603 RepID=A0ABW8AK84_9ACTN